MFPFLENTFTNIQNNFIIMYISQIKQISTNNRSQEGAGKMVRIVVTRKQYGGKRNEENN